VGRHQLLLLAHGAEEAERVQTETDQPNGCEQRQAQPGAGRHAQALAHARRREHQERQDQPSRDLDPYARHQRARGRPEARVGAGCEHQRGGERQQ